MYFGPPYLRGHIIMIVRTILCLKTPTLGTPASEQRDFIQCRKQSLGSKLKDK